MSEAEINRIIAERINYYLSHYGKTQVDLADYMEVSQATVSNWCKGVKMPRMDKIDKICTFFNIKRSDLMDGKTENETDGTYYLDDEAKEAAQFLYDNPEYKVLFDATRKVKKEDIDFVRQMLDRFKSE